MICNHPWDFSIAFGDVRNDSKVGGFYYVVCGRRLVVDTVLHFAIDTVYAAFLS